jgi:uncharacterized protein YegL
MKRRILLWATMLVLGHAGFLQAQEGPRLDVVFLLDATGSMGDEIDAVKEKIRAMISAIALGDPVPDVRFGIVAYRDRGDEYVTRVYDLTRDIDRIVDNLDQISADGGGDYPESFNEGLHVAVQELNWDREAPASRLVFLIADAPPHLDYADDYHFRDEVEMAQGNGIVIHAIGASGLDQEGEDIFREVAEATEGQFQWLAYETQYVDEDGEDVIVVVEGRTTTYKKGDEVWVVEEGGEMPEGLPAVGMGGREVSMGAEEDGAVLGDASAGAGGGGAAPVSSSTNLDDLITEVIKDAAAESGVDYENDGETAVESTSWGQVKARQQRR